MFQTDIDFGVAAINLKFSFFLLDAQISSHLPLPVAFFGAIACLASGTIGILIKAASTEIFLTQSMDQYLPCDLFYFPGFMPSIIKVLCFL